MKDKHCKIFVAGGTGLVGSGIIKNLVAQGYTNIISNYHQRKPAGEDIRFVKLDFMNQQEVEHFFATEKPEYVFQAAAKVGGIIANNTYRGQFIYENLQIQNNIIHSAMVYGVKKLLFLGSSCIYPKNCPQPMKESYLLTEELEYTNEPYAIAKIAGIKMCESYNLQYGTNFVSVMPTNLYGPNDNYHLENSHVLPALIRKIYLSKLLSENDFEGIRADLNRYPIGQCTSTSDEATIMATLTKQGIVTENGVTKLQLWGTGTPKREFLHSDDMADACVHIMQHIDFSEILKKDFAYDKPAAQGAKTEIRNTHINIGTGLDISIAELAEIVKKEIGFTGLINWDSSKPDGTMKKLLDVSKLESHGWKAKISLEEGVKRTIREYLSA